MEKVSAKTFFTVLWRGVCQALGWFFGLFGYKRDGKFAKCVWGLFATSAAVIVTIIAITMLHVVGKDIISWYNDQHFNCKDPDCWASMYINRDVYFHDSGDGKGYIFNKSTGEKLVKNVEWIAKPTTSDSLICFSNGKKRGYFSKNTGRLIIEPKYDHAWIFSEGLASVDEGGYIKFIDVKGKVVIDKKMPYIPDMSGYVFHGGYCVVDTDDGERCGLMDRNGKIVLPLEFCSITPTNDFKLWRVWKENEVAVLDKELKPVIPFMQGSIFIYDGTIDVTMPDHTMRKYDMQGQLIHDFYVTSVNHLEYEKGDFVYKGSAKNNDDEYEEYDEDEDGTYYRYKGTARLRSYEAGDGYEGLMTAGGHVVTMPIYTDISAIDYDLYLCTVTNGDKLIVNGKGEIVR